MTWCSASKGSRTRGPGGTELVISDHHRGLMYAIDTTMACVSWQRCSGRADADPGAVRARGRLIGTTSTDDKVALAREAGAAEVIRYDMEDVAGKVSRLTEGGGVDVVYDGVGQATFEDGVDSRRPRGMFVLYGAAFCGTAANVSAARSKGL